MSTAREFHSHPVPPTPAMQGSLWVRAAKAIKVALKWLAASEPMAKGTEISMTCSPVIAKIPAITVAGKHTRSVRKALSRMAPAVQLKPTRRPGLQGRWKTNNRVATQ